LAIRFFQAEILTLNRITLNGGPVGWRVVFPIETLEVSTDGGLRGEHGRDDRIMDFYYPTLSCFWKMISVSDPNPVLVKIILSVSQNYPKVYYDAQHTFLCSVYFAFW